MDTIKYVLTENQMPKAWYNIQADLPQALPPVLNPGTGKPITPDELLPLFPLALIEQEVSQQAIAWNRQYTGTMPKLKRVRLLSLILT
ncbi:MAG: hypothetical protein V7K67_33625 [Nostoc sp.]|uniref:hypothetical protein n=1 Tax=Nostoc sp. TaxID=1180 RepID=UPI002FFB9160